MTWQRTPVAAALVDLLTAATGGTVFVFDKPPATINPPAIIVSRPSTVLYNAVAFGVDEATLPVVIAGAMDGDDFVDALRDVIRKTVDTNPTLNGSVPACWPSSERNWRNAIVAGVDLLLAELVLTVQM